MSVVAWLDRFRNPMLTILLVLELWAISFIASLAGMSLPTAKGAADMLVLAVLVIAVMLSPRPGVNGG
jgi:hypothetical protein